MEVPSPQPVAFLERHNISPVLFAFLSLLAVFFLYQFIGGFLTLILVGGKVTPENVMMQRLFTMVGQILFILIPTLFFARLLDLRFSRVFPWRMPRVGETIFAILSLLFLQEVLEIYLFFQDRIPFPEDIRRIIDPARQMIEEMFRILVSANNIPELLFVVLCRGHYPSHYRRVAFSGTCPE